MYRKQRRPRFLRPKVLGRQSFELGGTVFANNKTAKPIPRGYRGIPVLELEAVLTQGAGGDFGSIENLANAIAQINGTIKGIQKFDTALTGAEWYHLLKAMGWEGQFPYNGDPQRSLTGPTANNSKTVKFYFPLVAYEKMAEGFDKAGLYGDQLDLDQLSIVAAGTAAAIEANLSTITGTWTLLAYCTKAERAVQHPEVYVKKRTIDETGFDYIVNDRSYRFLAEIAQSGVTSSDEDRFYVDGVNIYNADYGETIGDQEERRRLFTGDFIDEYNVTASTGVTAHGLNASGDVYGLTLANVMRYIDNRCDLGDMPMPKRTLRFEPAGTRTMFEVAFMHTNQEWANGLAKKAGISGVPTPSVIGKNGKSEPMGLGNIQPVDLGLLPQ